LGRRECSLKATYQAYRCNGIGSSPTATSNKLASWPGFSSSKAKRIWIRLLAALNTGNYLVPGDQARLVKNAAAHLQALDYLKHRLA